MATTKSKKTVAKSKPKTTSKSKSTKETKAEVTVKETKVVAQKTNCVKEFFARKYEPAESILTIFKSPKIYGAILGEIIGVMLLTLVFLTLGLYQPLFIMFVILVVTIAVYGISGANLNPLVTVGMMATRRMSVIRGVVYIVAQVVGAWLGLLVINAFRLGSGTAAELPAMAALTEKTFWAVAFVELIGAVLIGFFYARALVYKRSVFTFAAIVAGGVLFAVLFAIMISGNYFGYEKSFMLNPAVALMYQIFPQSGANFGEVLGAVAMALGGYVVFPMLGGTVGFYLADIASKLSGEETK